MLLACALLACSLFDQPDSEDAGPPRSTTGTSPPTTHSAPPIYEGPTSIEERILSSVAVVRARLTNTTTEIVTTTAEKWNEDYYVAVKFHLSVSEYLYGSGADSITAYWVSVGRLKTVQEAEAWIPTFTSRRDTQWDDREAILFLGDGKSGNFGALAQPQDVYLLAVGGRIHGDTSHFLTDKGDRRWLPAATATTATPIDSQEFLLQAPAPGTTPSTITLGDLKTKIAAIDAEIDAGDNSEAYEQCLKGKYTRLRRDEWTRRTDPQHRSYEPTWDGAFASGQPAGTELYKNNILGISEMVDGVERKQRFWLDGQDEELFSVNEINHRPFTALAPSVLSLKFAT